MGWVGLEDRGRGRRLVDVIAGRRTRTRVNGPDGRGGARGRKTATAAQLVAPSVGIDRGEDGERHGGGDRRSPATGWPKNVATSPAAIAATAEVNVGLKV